MTENADVVILQEYVTHYRVPFFRQVGTPTGRTPPARSTSSPPAPTCQPNRSSTGGTPDVVVG
jgi:hypothetical protein